jgi:hypothetical protein
MLEPEADGGRARDARVASSEDGGSSPSDARVDRDAPPPIPEDGVPMFVAVGWGGRRVMSCDGGRSWIADQQVADESEDDWHRSYTPKSLAYGDGTFVFLTGWGADSVAWVSANGIDWTEQALDTTYGGVGFDRDRFVLVGNRHLAESRDGGGSWPVLEEVEASTYDRDAAAFTGIWAAGADGAVETRRPGGEWTQLASCTGARHGSIGVTGGFEVGLGRLVSFGDDGDTCAIDIATGADLGAGAIGSRLSGRAAFVGDAFWVVTDGSIHSSHDGLAWSSRDLPDGVDFDLVARSGTGTYVGISGSGDRFYYSDDGLEWNEADGPSGNGLLRVVAGYGSPSADCPTE